jgi:hypothetical protein
MQGKWFFILSFWGQNQTAIFQTDADRMEFLKTYENGCASLYPTYAWSLTNKLAIFLLSASGEHDQIMKMAKTVIEKYNCDFFKTYRQKLTLQKKMKYLSQPDKNQLQTMVTRIHSIPLLQGLGNDFVEYPWTSYLILMGRAQNWMKADEVMEWFGGREKFREQHYRFIDEK